MKWIGLALASVLAVSAAACAGEPGADSVSESNLVSETRLDRVKPAEIAATYRASVLPGLTECIAAHPDITTITEANANAFSRVDVSRPRPQVATAIFGILRERNVTSLAVTDIDLALVPFAEAVLSRSVDGEGYYVSDGDVWSPFYAAEVKTREEKALSLAKNPTGFELTAVRNQWRSVEDERNTLESAFLNPVKLSGAPTVADVRRAIRLNPGLELKESGDAALAAFEAGHENPASANAFKAIATNLRTAAIKDKWYFYAANDFGAGWGGHNLVVLDEHNQLWGFRMGEPNDYEPEPND